MSNKKLKVVWLCTIANQELYSQIAFSPFNFKSAIKKIINKSTIVFKERAVWNTNAIREFENYEDISLTVVFPCTGGIKGKFQKFTIRNINYICYKTDDDSLSSSLFHFFSRSKSRYPRARKIVKSLIEYINPDIVHVVGAENPNYSICTLDIPPNIPCLVSLQTLMSEPNFKKDYPISKKDYEWRTSIENEVLIRCDYIASTVQPFKQYILNNIKKNALFLNLKLAVGVDINIKSVNKEYDFVYFANNVNKAADDAIESFALAWKKNQKISLNISGGYDDGFKYKMDKRIQELGLEKNVYITGPKQTHDEVINQIKKSRFAILPIKVDFISSTIREAMASGLPVVTTITQGTPSLNILRKSVLLSAIGDYQAMADNMIRLIEDESFARAVQNNAIITIKEKYSNEALMKNWRKAYYEIIDNFENGTPFSKDIVL